MTFILTSPSFKNNGEIPKRHSREGLDLSPALAWDGAPADAKEMVIICDDPDAPTPDPWVHWVIYGMEPKVSELPENIAHGMILNTPVRAIQGENSWNKIGYGGPFPPPGTGWHRYIFTLYALSSPLELKPLMTREQVLQSMHGKIIGRATLIGRYRR